MRYGRDSVDFRIAGGIIVQVLMHSNPWDFPGSSGYDEIEWHMWRTRQWPYLHINEGDTFFTVTGGGPAAGTIKSECRIEDLVLAPYSTHQEAWDLVRTGIPAGVRRQFLRHAYTRKAPPSGHLMAFVSRHIRDINQPRPDGPKLRPNGWARWDKSW
jgi:hypothetical protein